MIEDEDGEMYWPWWESPEMREKEIARLKIGGISLETSIAKCGNYVFYKCKFNGE